MPAVKKASPHTPSRCCSGPASLREFDFSALAHAHDGTARCRARLRAEPAHFRVDEVLPFPPDGEGGHALLRIEKTQTNSDWLARQLARFADVPLVDIGYAGMKDRNAITTQWFSIKLEGRSEPDWTRFDSAQYRILERSRHRKKLRRGVLRGNRFQLLLTDVVGDRQVIERQLQQISKQGVPNYFAEQRFGHHHGNLHAAQRCFADGRLPRDRTRRGLLLSAARAWLFNLVLAERVRQGSWNSILPGEILQLDGSGSVFAAREDDDDLQRRLAAFDIHPTGPLWGRGESPARDACLALEQAVLADWRDWQTGLEKAGLKQERRALRLLPRELAWQWRDEGLQLSFFLPAGSYATAVVRELALLDDDTSPATL